MRRVPVVAAFLVVVSGIYFQARINSHEVPTNTAISYPKESSSDVRLIDTGLHLGTVSGSTPLLSQIAGATPTNITEAKHHKVMLSWTPSEISATGGEIMGYYIYRCAGSSTKFFKLNHDPVNAPEYVDENVRSGRIYYYVATAVNRAGKQSRPSNLVRVVIPLP
jgi:hypothetical protein